MHSDVSRMDARSLLILSVRCLGPPLQACLHYRNMFTLNNPYLIKETDTQKRTLGLWGRRGERKKRAEEDKERRGKRRIGKRKRRRGEGKEEGR